MNDSLIKLLIILGSAFYLLQITRQINLIQSYMTIKILKLCLKNSNNKDSQNILLVLNPKCYLTKDALEKVYIR